MMRSSSILGMILMLLLLRGSDAKLEIITSKQDFLSGEEILLLCKAGVEGEITWQKDGEDVDGELVKRIDETSSNVFIKKATLQDMGQYTCHCEFDTGHKDEVQIQIFVHEGPSFGSTTVYHEFLEGTNGTVPCLVSGQPALDVSWFKDKEEISRNESMRVHQLDDNTLLIKQVKREDAGTYRCVAQIRKRPVVAERSISVVVNAPPTVHLKQEVKKVMARPETDVSLLCLVDGLPKPNITWNIPEILDPARRHFNSDHSRLSIKSVVRADLGEYNCTATNKIANSSATITLHVFEAPQVSVSADQQIVSLGQRVSVSCNVSGYPEPTLHWLSKYNGQIVSISGHIRVNDGVLEIDEMAPSDGGLYSCMAVTSYGNASKDAEILTQPSPPLYLSISTKSTSIFFSIKQQPISGGSAITSYVLQWRQGESEPWMERTMPVSDSLILTPLKPYTSYNVRVAATNKAGLGEFSDVKIAHTKSMQGEPDGPVLPFDVMKMEGNSFTIPLKQLHHGQSPLLYYKMRYRQRKDGDEWKEKQLPSNSDVIVLKDLTFGSEYQLEVTAVNANGSSFPATLNFTIAQQPASQSMTKGSIVGVVMVIFLVVFLVVDVTCCYTNRCGLLMTVTVKIFGKRVPGLKMLEDGDMDANGEVKLKGLATPRASLQHTAVQTSMLELNGVTCDKAPLTKHEKTQPDRSQTTAEA